MSRNVMLYAGASHEGAEGGFVDADGTIYINTNAPQVINQVEVVLGHEYTHTLEGTEEYNAMKNAIFASDAFARMLNDVGMTRDQLADTIIARYQASGKALDKPAAEREIIAQFIGERLLQNERNLAELAKATRFAQFVATIRRFLARLSGKLENDRDLVKIERLLQRAVRAAAKNPAATKSSGVRSMIMTLPDGRKYVQATRQGF